MSRENRPVSGKPWPFELFFRSKTASKQIESARPPARQAGRVGRRPRKYIGDRPRPTLPAAPQARCARLISPLRSVRRPCGTTAFATGRVGRRLRRRHACARDISRTLCPARGSRGPPAAALIQQRIFIFGGFSVILIQEHERGGTATIVCRRIRKASQNTG